MGGHQANERRSSLAIPDGAVLGAVVLVSALIVSLLGARVVGQRDLASTRTRIAVALAPIASDVSSYLTTIPAESVASVEADLLDPSGETRFDPTDVDSASGVRARDSGESVLVTSDEDAEISGVDVVAVLVPVYSDGGELTTTPPPTTAERRRRSAGLIRVDRTDGLREIVGSDDFEHLDLALQLTGATGSMEVDPGAVGFLVGPDQARLQLVATVPGVGAGDQVAVVFGGLVVGLLGAIAMVVSERRRAVIAIERDEARRDLTSVVDIVPVVQQSLDVGDVLPAVAISMMDAFRLRGVKVIVRGATGDVELFTTGAEGSVGADRASIEVPLQRGNRRLGSLLILPGADLDDRQRSVLRLLGDMVASALANAALYVQQQAAVERMREIDEVKTVFLATASHELRTPITAISGFANVLHRSWDNFDEVERRGFAERIAVNSRSLEHLISQLLDFSRMEAGRLDEGAALDLDEVVESMGAMLASQVPDHVLEIHHGNDCWVNATSAAVDRILSNLVTNVGKYSPAGGRIDVRIARHGDEVSVVVDDQGAGVDPQERDKIFGRFFRGRGEEVMRTRGAGVGLSIVHDFVVALGGAVEVTDAPAGGARFIVTMPAVVAPHTHNDESEAARAN